MKKNKILLPILTIAGLSCSIVPLVTMTSCGNKGEKYETEKLEDMEMKVKESTNYYTTKPHTFEKNIIYKTKIDYKKLTLSGNTKLSISYEKEGKEGFFSGIIEESLSIKVTYNTGDVEIMQPEATGSGNYTFGNFQAGIDSTIEISWRNESDEQDLQLILCNV